MKNGRPTKYDPKFVDEVYQYCDECVDTIERFQTTYWEKSDSYKRIVVCNMPTLPWFAVRVYVSKRILIERAKKDEKFLQALWYLLTKQEQFLIRGGATWDYNSWFCKFLLISNHWHKQELSLLMWDKSTQAVSDAEEIRKLSPIERENLRKELLK